MKHTLLAIAALCSFACATAQQGSILLFGNTSGGFGTDRAGVGESSRTYLAINPGLGYQFSQHITAGLQGGYMRYSTAYKQPGYPTVKETGTEVGIAAFGRYTSYLTDRIFVYLQADAGYNHGQHNVPNPAFGSNLGASLSPAVGFFIYKNWAINASIGGISWRYGLNPSERYNTLNWVLGQSVQFGVSKNFVRKAKQPQTPGSL
ncbi:MAG: hypothetical protein V4649_07380 [Bacteroidota bacterium]